MKYQNRGSLSKKDLFYFWFQRLDSIMVGEARYGSRGKKQSASIGSEVRLCTLNDILSLVILYFPKVL